MRVFLQSLITKRSLQQISLPVMYLNAFLQYGGSRTREYVDAGYILDLTPYFEQYPEWKKGIQDFAWETTQFDGIELTYGIPWSAYQLCLYYNKDYLDQVGIDVPESWDDLVDACAKLKDAGIQPFNYAPKDNYHFEHLISALALKAYGTSIADDLASDKKAYNGEKMVAIYQKMKDMIDAGYWRRNSQHRLQHREKYVRGRKSCIHS